MKILFMSTVFGGACSCLIVLMITNDSSVKYSNDDIAPLSREIILPPYCIKVLQHIIYNPTFGKKEDDLRFEGVPEFDYDKWLRMAHDKTRLTRNQIRPEKWRDENNPVKILW